MFHVEPPAVAADGYRTLSVGDPAPWFEQATSSDDRLSLEVIAGRYVVLCFFVSGGDALGKRALAFLADPPPLDDQKLVFYGVSIDWRDQAEGRAQETPGVRFFWDFDASVARRYGVLAASAAPGPVSARRMWCILDPTLRVRAILRFERDGSEQATLRRLLAELPPLERFSGAEVQAPILYLPQVFEPELCRQLILLYKQQGGTETGFLQQIGARTVEVHEHRHKRRSDYLLGSAAAIAEVQARITRRVVPELEKAYQFRATRIERYLIGCYRAEHGGHFAAHRDNTTGLTAHRRFALSINLNDDYEGGEIGFPEYGPRCYKPPIGGAVVFSCSLLHSVAPLTRGNRYAFLPFLHDESAELALREKMPITAHS